MFHATDFTHDPELGVAIADDRLPLIRLREMRRELVLSLADGRPLSGPAINEIACVHQAIKAIEAVMAE